MVVEGMNFLLATGPLAEEGIGSCFFVGGGKSLHYNPVLYYHTF